MILPFVSDPCAKCCYASKRKMLDIYQTYPMFNLVPVNFKSWDENQSYKLQHVLGNNFSLTNKKTCVDFLNYKNRRLVAKSCSDSSMEGRSSDSTYTSSSGGGSGDGNAPIANDNKMAGGGISGRFTRQPMNSRFPAMDLNTNYARVHKPPTYYPGMGAYAHLQQQQYNMSSLYPKVNYTLPHHQRRRPHQQQQQQQQQQQHQMLQVQNPYQQQQQKSNGLAQESFKQTETYNSQLDNANNDDDLDGTYTICQGVPSSNSDKPYVNATKVNQQHQQQLNGSYINNNNNNANNNNNQARRFVNVEKFALQSNKLTETNENSTSQVVLTDHTQAESKEATPSSAKSITYSQKSTASARSGNSGKSHMESGSTEEVINTWRNEGISHSKATTASSNFENPLEIEVIEDEIPLALPDEQIIETENKEVGEMMINRSASVLSMQSKSESIKTQLEDTPPAISRATSVKSLVIEEDIEGNDSFVIVEQAAEQEYTSEGVARNSPEIKNSHEIYNEDKTMVDDDVVDGEVNEITSKPNTGASRPPSRQRSPTIAELKTLSRRNSMVKSMESLYIRAPLTIKQDSLDTTTESSSQSSNQAIQPVASSIPIKPQHTPLKQKAKTSCFLRNHRRISPVKQSIKMQQAELYPSTLQRFDKPREALLKTFDQLDSPNWEIIMQGLKSMVRLMRYHADYLESQMHMVCIQLTRSVRNLRSQVARAACQSATELFLLKSKTLEQECDDLICALLHRTADTNRFIRADATRALESMSDNLTPPKILNLLTTKGALHQNALVRTTAAKMLNRLVARLGYDKIYTMSRENRDKFFVTGANLLLEGSLETRSYAKSLFRQLSEHPSYNRLLVEVIPSRTYRNVEKTLKSIR